MTGVLVSVLLLASMQANQTAAPPIWGTSRYWTVFRPLVAAMIPEIAAATGAGPNAGQSLRRVAEGTLEFLRTHQ